MKTAVVARSPVFARSARQYGDRDTKRIPGVSNVVPIRSGVAVIADATWSAFRGREALKISRNGGAHAAASSGSIRDVFEKLASREGAGLQRRGSGWREWGLSQGSCHVTLLGGGFGCRLVKDCAAEATMVWKAAGAPVKAVWTREDDMRNGDYRPITRQQAATV